MLCAEWTAVNHLSPGIKAIPLWCRAWTCENCAPERYRQLKAAARDGAPDTFITLTSNPSNPGSVGDRAAQLSKAWRQVRRLAMDEAARDPAARTDPKGAAPADGWQRDHKGRVPRQVRLHGGKFPFLAVFERHKSGEPHLHIICRTRWVDQRWLSVQMESLIGAPVVDVRRVRDQGRVAYYVAKYMAKDPTRFEGCKRYWSSTDWLADCEPWETPLIEGGGWQVVKQDVWSYVEQTLALGSWEVTWERDVARLHCRGPD